MNDINDAIRLAAIAHAGQVDKQGQPYILHPLRVGAMGKTSAEQIVGFLHDVLEDTDLSASVLQQYFSTDIMVALDSVTRAPGEGYRAYVARAANNPVGRAVKINDLHDNLARMGTLPSRAEAGFLWMRYRLALNQLGA